MPQESKLAFFALASVQMHIMAPCRRTFAGKSFVCQCYVDAMKPNQSEHQKRLSIAHEETFRNAATGKVARATLLNELRQRQDKLLHALIWDLQKSERTSLAFFRVHLLRLPVEGSCEGCFGGDHFVQLSASDCAARPRPPKSPVSRSLLLGLALAAGRGRACWTRGAAQSLRVCRTPQRPLPRGFGAACHGPCTGLAGIPVVIETALYTESYLSSWRCRMR